jgi:hypothetical protein
MHLAKMRWRSSIAQHYLAPVCWPEDCAPNGERLGRASTRSALLGQAFDAATASRGRNRPEAPLVTAGDAMS